MTAAQPSVLPARHILVVDDDSQLREQVVGYLTEHGFQVHAAADAKAMDRILGSSPIDLVVLDLMLPGEDGLSICRRLTAEGGPAARAGCTAWPGSRRRPAPGPAPGRSPHPSR